MPPDVSLVIAPDLPLLRTARAPLEHVFVNLLSNANKHRDGAPVQIVVSAKQCTGGFQFSIKDDGPGIEPRLHAKIFNMFETVKPRDEMEATGVGLAIVKKIVEGRGGAIGLASRPGHGSEFRFTWPTNIVAV